MTRRTFVTFEADFPDDSELSTDGEIASPSGRGILSALASKLADQGLRASSPIQHSFYGWELNAINGKGKFWFVLQFPGPWLLISEDKTEWLRRVVNPTSLHNTILEKLDESMSKDARFKAIRWYTRDEYGRASSSANVSPAP